MDRLYGIRFLHEKFDIFFSSNGIPGSSPYQRLQFVIINKFPKTKACLIGTLRQKFAALQFDDEDFKCLSLLDQEDRHTFFMNFDWQKHLDAFKNDPSLLKRYWVQAQSLQISQIRDQVIQFRRNSENDGTFFKAWGVILPDQLFIIQ